MVYGKEARQMKFKARMEAQAPMMNSVTTGPMYFLDNGRMDGAFKLHIIWVQNGDEIEFTIVVIGPNGAPILLNESGEEVK